MANSIQLRRTALVVNRKRYFRSGAEKLSLGTYGNKEVGALKANNLFPYGTLEIASEKIQEVGPFNFDFSNTSKVEAAFDANTLAAEGKLELSYENVKSGSLVFVQFSIEAGNLINTINKDTQALHFLKAFKRPRIVNTIFVVISAELARNLSKAGSFSIKSNKNLVEITAKINGAQSKEEKIILPPKSTIAYGMVNPSWDANNEKVKMVRQDTRGII